MAMCLDGAFSEEPRPHFAQLLYVCVAIMPHNHATGSCTMSNWASFFGLYSLLVWPTHCPPYHTQVASLAGKCTFLCRVRRLPTAFLYRIGRIVVTLPHVANVVKPKTTTKTTIRRKIEGVQQELLHSVLNACCETLCVDSSVFLSLEDAKKLLQPLHTIPASKSNPITINLSQHWSDHHMQLIVSNRQHFKYTDSWHTKDLLFDQSEYSYSQNIAIA